MLAEHGCTVPWMPNPTICHADHASMEGLLSTYDVLVKSGKILDMCQQPCNTMKFVFGWPDIATQDSSTGHVRMYFSSKIVMKRGVLDYTWLSAVAEMGGYAGLLLGVAVVDVAFAAEGYWLKLSSFFRSIKRG